MARYTITLLTLMVIGAAVTPAAGQYIPYDCPGDFDDDRFITLADCAQFTDCLAGPGETPLPTSPLSWVACVDVFDLDGDGDVDLTDFRGMQRLNGMPCPECGNSIVEYGEECDPPTDGACTAECLNAIANDNCDSPIAIGDGITIFDNFRSTGEGLDGACGSFNLDVWFAYTATCDGFVTVSLCGSEFDTVVEVFDTNGCSTSSAIACNDDGCGSGTQSRTAFTVTLNTTYVIRVGGHAPGNHGEGMLTLSCADTTGFLSCDAGSGDCYTANDSAGCGESSCCETVCVADAYCCDVEWDAVCVATAMSLCGAGYDACRPGTGDCMAANGTPGCEDPACCEAICDNDWYCCMVEWSQACVDAAQASQSCPAVP